MQALFLWFYCLTLPQAVILSVCAMWIVLHLHRQFSGRRPWRLFLGVMFVLGLAAILAQTVLLRSPGEKQEAALPLFASYRALKAGGNPEILRSNLMNVLLFCPLGLCGCLLWGRSVKLWQAALVTAGLFVISCGIEWVQLETGRGLCEADDVFHNTLGALTGSLFSWLYGKIYH